MNKIIKISEDFVVQTLHDWFESYNGIKSWKNKHHPCFKTKLSQKKPDMVIFSNKLNQYIAIEVKIGNRSKDIYDASKIIEYWEDYKNNKIEYYINNKKIIISSFCVATYNSRFGKLFSNDTELIDINSIIDDTWKYYCKTKGIEPLWEYRRTHDYLRSLWSTWRKKREKKNQPGLGIILANLLNHIKKPGQEITRPLLFDMQYENQKRKSKWQNRQKVL